MPALVPGPSRYLPQAFSSAAPTPGTGSPSRIQPSIMARGRIKMSSAMALALALSSGVSLGVIYFGGLWWTVLCGALSSVPALWFSASYLIRTAVALGGFYLVSHDDGRR